MNSDRPNSHVTLLVSYFSMPLRHGVILASILRPVSFDIENRRAIEKVQTAHEEPVSFAPDETHEREPDRVGSRGGIQGEHAHKRELLEFEAPLKQTSWLYFQRTDLFRPEPVKVSDDEQMRIAVDAIECVLELRKNFQLSFQVALLFDFSVTARGVNDTDRFEYDFHISSLLVLDRRKPVVDT